jgi:hypothetical protein
MKQTAVNWLVEQIKSDQNQKTLSANEWMEVIEQAKDMEKEQIIDAYCQGVTDIIKDENIFPAETSEEYYNQNYLKQQL